MAQDTLVDMQLEEAQRLIDRLRQEGVEVTAAGWVNESESGDWYLYMATPLVTEDGATTPAYRRVNSVIREMQKEGFGMDPFQIKLISPRDQTAKDLVAQRAPRPGVLRCVRKGKNRLGELAFEEAWIYPRLPTSEETAGMQLWGRGGLELKPGIGLRGRCCRAIVDLDRGSLVPGSDHSYHGPLENPRSMRESEAEITWAEGGAIRVIATATDNVNKCRWVWSQLTKTWDQGGSPPQEILRKILAALG